MKGKKVGAKERLERLEKDKKERAKVFAALLKHVRAGYSLDCFGPLSVGSIRSMLKRFSNEFCEEELEHAIREGKAFWEDIGRRQSNGSCLGNSRSWYYNMVNRFGWREKVDIAAEHKGEVSVNVVSYASKKARQDSVEGNAT